MKEPVKIPINQPFSKSAKSRTEKERQEIKKRQQAEQEYISYVCSRKKTK